MKPDSSEQQMSAIRQFCAENPNSNVPNSVNNTASQWRCNDTVAVIDNGYPTAAVDKRGYFVGAWVKIANNRPTPPETKSQTVTPQVVTTPTMAVLAMIAAAKSQNNAAILSAKVALDSFPKPDCGDRKLARERNKVGLDSLKQNAYESAIARLNEGVAADPSDVELKNNLGYALLMAGRLDDARKTLIDTLALESARGAAWANLGQTLAKQGDEDSAVAAFVNTFIFSRAQNKTVEYFTNLSQSDPDPRVKFAAAKALETPTMKSVTAINK